MSDLSSMPDLALENIFTFLDGVSLARISLTCKRLHDIASALMSKLFTWRINCVNDIPMDTLEELLGNLTYSKELWNSIEWKEVYLAWYRGNVIKSIPSTIKSFFVNDPVTCVKMSGDCIITSHRNGSIIAWVNFSQHHVITRHAIFVTDFVLIDSEHLGPYCLNYINWRHTHLISVSKDHGLQITYLFNDGKIGAVKQFSYFHGSSLNFVRVFNNMVIVLAADETLLLFQIEIEEKFNMRLKLIHTVMGFTHYVEAILLWSNTIRFFASFGGCYSIQLETIKQNEKVTQILKMSGKTCNFRNNLRRAFLFRKEIAFIETFSGQLFIAIGNNIIRKFQYMQYTQSCILSMDLAGSILAMGTEAGKLLLYRIFDEQDLYSLDLGEPVWSKNLSEASIISINISGENEKPFVVACTTDTVFHVSWKKEDKRNRSVFENRLNLP